jgi:hypothetical protein
VPFPGRISRTSSPVSLDRLTEDEQHAPLEDHPGPWAIHGLLEALARPWTTHILWTLSISGPTRFGALRRRSAGLASCFDRKAARTGGGGHTLPGMRAHNPSRCDLRNRQAGTSTSKGHQAGSGRIQPSGSDLAAGRCKQAPGIRGQISSPTGAGTPSSGKPDLASSRLQASPSAP